MRKILLHLIVIALAAPAILAQKSKVDLGPWPKGGSPQEIGKRLAERFIASPHPNFFRPQPPKTITYPESCAWYGTLAFAQLSGDPELNARIHKRFEPLLTSAESKMIPEPTHVDASVFGIVPLEMYIQTKDAKYLEIGKTIADKQWQPIPGKQPSEETKAWVERGLTPQTRMWIDDMFMVTALQAQAYRATGDRKYLDRAAVEMAAYLQELQKANGLFFHAPDVPFYWGRGNGWVAAGMTEMLRSLPEDHPQRPVILEGYRKMMASLLQYQDSNGMWHQLIDKADAWPETSCTAMFTFAMISGVKNGWLDAKTYGPAARKGWLGVIQYINDDGDVREVCEGTNKKNDLQYYYDRARRVGDMHGQAPILWCASALLR